MMREEHATQLGEIKNAYQFFFAGNLKLKTTLARLRHRRENNLKIYLNVWQRLGWFCVGQDRGLADC